MGGGPSREEREHTRRLEEIQRQQAQTQQQFLTLASQPDPLTERLRARDTAWLDWSEGKDAQGNAVPIDVTRAPGLGPSLNLYNRARLGEENERYGIGALRMGVQGSNPNLANLLKEQRTAHRERDAAGALEQAVATREAETTGSVLPLASLQQNQRMGLASLASGNANNALNNLTQFVSRPRRRSFWQDLLLTGFSGGQQAAAAIGGGG
jgi:hypothetical protein